MKKKISIEETRKFKLGRRDDTNIDMLHGPLTKNIILFAIPIILSTFLQLLFNAADLVVVGQFCGEDSLAAVGATSAISQLIINLFTGLSIGVSVRVSNGFGENSWIKVNKTVHTCIPLALIGGAIVAIGGWFLSEPLLVAMDTPSEILSLSVTYLRIYFLGIPFNLVYNYGAAVLRADGDSKKPLQFLTISGILNVILNVIFVTVINLNVAGVALATALTTALSAILVVIELTKKNDAAKLQFKYIKLDKKAVKEILRMGLPAGLQNSMFSLSNVLIQSFLNGFGKATIAGSSAASNILGFGMPFLIGFSQCAMNFAGQNFGAKQYDRVHKIKRICFVGVTISCLAMYILIYCFGTQLLAVYNATSPEAIYAGLRRMIWVGLPTFINGLFDVLSSILRAMKSSITPAIISIAGICGIRLLIVYTVFQIPQFHTLDVLYSTYIISWVCSLVAGQIAYKIISKKKFPKEAL